MNVGEVHFGHVGVSLSFPCCAFTVNVTQSFFIIDVCCIVRLQLWDFGRALHMFISITLTGVFRFKDTHEFH